MIKKLTEVLMGTYQYKVRPETCAYRLRIDEMIDREQDLTNVSSECMLCDGYPEKGCCSYTTLDHILNYYRLFKNEVNI